eukprot:UN04128
MIDDDNNNAKVNCGKTKLKNNQNLLRRSKLLYLYLMMKMIIFYLVLQINLHQQLLQIQRKMMINKKIYFNYK